MGCCISKFTPKTEKFRHEEEEEDEEYSYVQDKLVVSHYQSKVSPVHFPEKKQFVPIPDKVIHIHIPDKLPPPSPPPLPPSKLSPFSPTQTSTTSNTSVSSSSSSLSTASSVSVSKDRSFSNEFLHACYRDNPHVVRINSLRESSLSLKTSKPATPCRSNSPARAKRYHPSTPNRSNANSKKGTEGSPLQKRVWANSPSRHPFTRQNSFLEGQERLISSSANSIKSGKFLKSPSPSRRFGMAGSRVNPVGSVSSSQRQESLDLRGSTAHLGNRSETRIHRIGSKIDENVVKEVITSQNEHTVPPEDIDNPLISLDCFIFL